MRKIRCEACEVREGGGVCAVAHEKLEEFLEMGVTSMYKPRQVIFSAGNRSDGLYIVCYGSVKLYQSDRFGRDHILEVAAPGAVLGEVSADPAQTLSASAEAVTETQVCFLQRDRLYRFLESDPSMATRLIEALSRELALARRKAGELALKRADSRLAALILQLAGSSPAESPVRLDYSRRELAEMIGVSAETASRLLAKLKSKGVIALEGRTLALSDPERLAQIASYSDVEL